MGLRLFLRIRKGSEQPKPKKGEIMTTKLTGLTGHDEFIAKTAMKALANGFRLEVEYNGLPRIVEVHAVGVSTAGKPCMRVFQVQGDSHSGEGEGWKLMTIAKINHLELLDNKSLAPREGYRKGDMGMSTIFTEV